MNEWMSSTLPRCMGHPCEELRIESHVARVWQTSLITTRGEWCWAVSMVDSEEIGEIHSIRGEGRSNRGIAKATAQRALVRVVRRAGTEGASA